MTLVESRLKMNDRVLMQNIPVGPATSPRLIAFSLWSCLEPRMGIPKKSGSISHFPMSPNHLSDSVKIVCGGKIKDMTLQYRFPQPWSSVVLVNINHKAHVLMKALNEETTCHILLAALSRSCARPGDLQSVSLV